MLLPPSVMVPKLDAQLPPAVLLARMLLVTVSGPGSRLELKMAPPSPLGALLPEKVLLVTVAVPLTLLLMAPPPAKAPPALLSEKVLLVTVSVPPLTMAPPASEALLPKKVLLVTLTLPPLLTMAPPPPALLPEKVQLVTVSGKRLPLKIAPPLLPEKVLLVTFVVPKSATLMAPPLLPEKVLLVTFVVPFEKIAPPEAPTTAPLPEKVQLVTVSVPPLFSMALGVPPAMVTLSSARTLPWFTANTPLMLPPLMVITPPPSMMVLAPLRPFVLVTVIVAAPPQLKVTVPLKLLPPGRQASNAASVQLALVPVPTTHANADEVAPSTPKTSSARTNTRGVRTVAVLIACLPC